MDLLVFERHLQFTNPIEKSIYGQIDFEHILRIFHLNIYDVTICLLADMLGTYGFTSVYKFCNICRPKKLDSLRCRCN